MNKTDKKEVLVSIWIVLFITATIVSILFLGINIGKNSNPPKYTIQNQCLECNKIYGDSKDYVPTYLNFLNDVQENCGTTHFVKKFNSTDWSLFKVTNYGDGLTQSNYIEIEDCLKVQ